MLACLCDVVLLKLTRTATREEASPMTLEALCKLRACCRFFMPVIFAAALAVPLASAQDNRSAPDEPGPVFSDGGPDAELYGKASGYPAGARGTSNELDKLVGAYSH